MIKKLIYIIPLVLQTSIGQSYAQCAMCRATIENNLSNGDIGIGAGLNFGILYLFVMPYLAAGIIAYFWYRHSRANARKYGSIKGNS